MSLIKKFIKEEEDGSVTTTYATDMRGGLVTHNNKGPALVNKTQNLKEYYLYGVKVSKDMWEKKKKLS